MSTGTWGRIQKHCMPEKMFSKKDSKYDILNLYFGPNFVFGDCFKGILAGVFIFVVGQNDGGRHFYSAPPPPTYGTVKTWPGPEIAMQRVQMRMHMKEGRAGCRGRPVALKRFKV